MLDAVGQRLLDDPEEARLHGGRDLRGAAGFGVERDLDAGALRELLRVARQRRQQPAVVQHRRPEIRRDLADAYRRLPDQVRGIVQQGADVLALAIAEQAPEHLQVDLDRRELRAGPIVQLRGELAPFGLLDFDEAPRQFPEALLLPGAFGLQLPPLADIADDRHGARLVPESQRTERDVDDEFGAVAAQAAQLAHRVHHAGDRGAAVGDAVSDVSGTRRRGDQRLYAQLRELRGGIAKEPSGLLVGGQNRSGRSDDDEPVGRHREQGIEIGLFAAGNLAAEPSEPHRAVDAGDQLAAAERLDQV